LNGPYAVLDIITIMAQDSYIHTGANADNDTLYYYLLTNQGIAGTTMTDTLSTIFLDGFTNDDEIIDFSWSPPHYPSPYLPEMYPKYFLYREYPPGYWTIADSTENLSLTNHFWECNGNNDTVRFKIGVRNDENSCISFSNQVGKLLKNLRKPGQPGIDSVSIDGTDLNCMIGWQAGTDLDIVGYIIYRVSGTIDSIGYASGKATSFYIDSTSTPCNGPVKYVLSAIDSCGNKSPLSFRPHNSLYLQDISYDPCLMTNTLTWNNYRNFDPPLQGYMIYMSENGGPYQTLVTLDTNTTVYYHENLQPNTAYSYFIRAFNQGHLKTSTSCAQTINTYNSPKPQFMYTRYVTVEDNERVSLLFYTDTIAHVQYYRILRSTQQSGSYEEISVIQDQGQESVSFTDEEALVNAESYYYQVEVIDSCGLASVIANTARTIFLEVEALPDLISRLSWNAYESWSGEIAGYRIYRRLDDGAPDPIADLDPLTLVYDDDVSGLTGSISKISYLVEAYEGESNIYGFRERSFSNEVMSEQEPEVFMPNAFAPAGINNVLKPQTVFVGSEGYEFLVYNRWGQLIFSTRDPGQGWDGKFKGDFVPQDVYVYIIFYRNALNQPRQTRGNVLVLY
jgi:gliding motility-associated-like protein